MQQKLSLDAVFELFLLDCEARGFTKHTLRFYRERLSLFIQWCKGQGVGHLYSLNGNHIRQFFVYLQRKNLSSAYIHSFARAIKTFCNYCVRDNLVETSPFSKVQMPKLAKRILPALAKDEINRILDKCETERDLAIILFLLDSGVRATELAELNVGDVSMKTGAVAVNEGKGQKDRTTYVGAKTRKQLRRYLLERGNPDKMEPLFVSERGGNRLTYNGLSQILQRLRKSSGVKECHAHSFRRTFAINCLRNGMDVFVLARLMGHADLTVLKQYLDLVKDDLEKAHDKHGPVDNMNVRR